jgi:acyl carrier protein
MAKILTTDERQTIMTEIREFLADELGVELDRVTPEAKIIDDLVGDSMIYLELVEKFKKKYQIQVEIRVIGKYLLSHPVHSVGEVSQAVFDIIEKGDDLIKE